MYVCKTAVSVTKDLRHELALEKNGIKLTLDTSLKAHIHRQVVNFI